MKNVNDTIGIIILAAGKGTRMKSDKAKVLHLLSGRPLILHVVETAAKVEGKDIIVVVGHEAKRVKEVVSENADVKFALQNEQKGTGHAVLCALPHLSEDCGHVVILSGDVPLIRHATILDLIEDHIHSENAVTVLGVCLENPFGYGRLVESGPNGIEKIVEERDADESEKKINIVNSGIYCVNKNFLGQALSEVTADNNQNEIYLTDIVQIASQSHKKIGLKICDEPTEVMGVNTLDELRNIESILTGS